MTAITNIFTLPGGYGSGTGIVNIIITSGVPGYFEIQGSELDKITGITWYPTDSASVEFETRQLILADTTKGTFMIQVTNNFLYNNDRGGKLSIRLDTGDTISYPVVTYGPVSIGPLWTSPYDGLDTGY